METLTPKKQRKNKKIRFVRSIINEIEEINPTIPDDIKLEAEKESLKHVYSKSVRKKKKINNIAECVFKAYENLGNPKDPVMIAKLLNVNKNEITKTINSSSDNYIIFHFPHEYIKDYLMILCPDNDIDDLLKNITELAFQVYELKNDILDKKPQDVAVALILFYMQKFGFVIENKEGFYSDISKSSATINKLIKTISSAVNS